MMDVIKAMREHFIVEYYPDGRIASVGHNSEALRKVVKILDDAIAKGGAEEIFPGWTHGDQNDALFEGWYIVKCDSGQIVIKADNDHPVFTGEAANEDAQAYVLFLGESGSRMHSRAIMLVEHPDNLALGRANAEE